MGHMIQQASPDWIFNAMEFAPAVALLLIEILIVFLLAIGAISLITYVVVRIYYKAKKDALNDKVQKDALKDKVK